MSSWTPNGSLYSEAQSAVLDNAMSFPDIILTGHNANSVISIQLLVYFCPVEKAPWTIEFYEEADGREPVMDFLERLDEYKEQALLAAIENILAYKGTGVCGSSWGKWVQTGIFEFRLRYDAATILRQQGLPVPAELEVDHKDILLRVFCHAHGAKIVLLLAAYDKGKEPSATRQNAEIKRAKQRLRRFKSEQARLKKTPRQADKKGKTAGKRKA